MSRRADASETAFWGEVDDTEARARYRSLVNAVDDGIYHLDADGRVVAVNDSFVELTGRARENFLGDTVAALFEDSESIEREVDRLTTGKGDGSARLEAAISTAADGPIACEVRMDAVEPDGALEGVVGTVRAIRGRGNDEGGDTAHEDTDHEGTEVMPDDSEGARGGPGEQEADDRAERERKLERIERRFEAMFEDPNVLVGLLEPDGTVVDINETAMDYVDAEFTDVRGIPFWETPWWGNGDDVQADVKEWTARAAAGEYVDFQADLTRPDGERYALEGYFRPVTDEEGNVVSIIVSDRDVTERTERERQLRESERRYRTLAEYFPNGLVTLFDRDLVYTLAAGQGFDRIPLQPGDVEGKQFSEVWDESTAEALEPLFQGALDGEERSVELEYASRDWIIHAVPITDERGEVFAGMTMALDITERKQREQYLRDAKSQIEAAAEAGAVGTWEWHIPEDRFVADASLARKFGIDPEEAREGVSLGRLVDSIYEADRERVQQEIEAAVEACSEYETEYRVWNAEGELRWVVARGHVECDEDGEPVLFPGALTDITERKEQQREIKRSERRYRTLVENFPNGSVGLFNDDLEYTVVGGQLLDRLDLSPDDRIGRSIHDIHPDELLEDIEPYFLAALDGERNSFEIEYGGRYLYAHALPVRNADDEVFAGMLVVQDVTERREAQRELRESEAKFRMIAENLEEIVWMATEDGGEFVYINPAFEEVWGIDREELYDEPTSFLDAIHPADRERVREAFAALPEREFDEEYRIRRADGEVRWVRSRGASVHDEDSGMARVVGIGEDVTERVERERELERSERRYRTVVENFPNGAVALVDSDLRYVTIGGNPLAERELTADDLEGRSIREVLAPELVDRLEPLYRSALDGEPATLEYSHESGDRHSRFRTFPVRDEDGEIFGAMGMSQDITEQVERERRLEESERRYRTLAENFPNGAVAVYDEDLRFTLTQGAELGDVLPPREDLEGQTIPEVFPPEIAENLQPLLRAAVEDGESGSRQFEFGGRHWRTRATPLRDANGEIFAGLSFSQDITEQVEREAELERALDLLERTERIADVGGWEIDPRTEAVFWSDHLFDLLEVDAEEEPPLDEALDMYHEDDRPIVEDAIEAALATGSAFDVEVRLRTAGSGEVRWLRLQGLPETTDGDIVTLRGAAQDVTERVEREAELEDLIERLEESNERLEQFAYAASHDLQEPLRMVSSYLQLIERRYEDELDADGREFISYAVDGADRMREMIDGLLQYSRVDTRGDPFEPVDLDAVFADVRDDLQVRIEETEAEVTAEDLPQVEGDGGQLRQVFQNLLDNAIEYSGEDSPRVHVSAERAGDWWEISVSDEGIGIEPEDTDRVFEVFQSLHSRADHGGTGIGLALCERIIERHGGDIRVSSEPGRGSTFTFTLPPVGEHSARP
ncbi:PAS domain-containing protein [Halosimplex sp. J119]